MNDIIELLKDNLIPVCLVLGGAIVLVVVLVILLKKPKPKKVMDKIKFEQGIERFERIHFKKCRKCGGNVPIEDHLCQNCGEIPD